MIINAVLLSSGLILSAGSALLTDTSVSITSQSVADHVEVETERFPYESQRVDRPDHESIRRHLLSGTWQHEHQYFGKNGFGLLFDYSADNQSNLHGGLQQAGAYQHKVELIGTLDAGVVVGWRGATVLVHLMHTAGEQLAHRVGSAQASSNLGFMRSTRLYQAWLQQRLLGDKLSILAGLYDLNSEFYLTPVSNLFLNSSFAIGKDLSQTGAAAFPLSAVGVRMRIDAPPYFTVKLAALDAVPDSRSGRLLPDVHISKKEGGLLLGEVNFLYFDTPSTHTGTYALGVWRITAPAKEMNRTALSGLPHESNANVGYYLTGEQRVYSETTDPRQGLDIFLRMGFANGHIHRYSFNISGGITYTGLLAGRASDKVGLAVTHANNAVDYQQALRVSGDAFAPGELVVEFTYRAQITPWLVLQPDVQYVLHPGTNPGIENAAIVGSRINIGF